MELKITTERQKESSRTSIPPAPMSEPPEPPTKSVDQWCRPKPKRRKSSSTWRRMSSSRRSRRSRKLRSSWNIVSRCRSAIASSAAAAADYCVVFGCQYTLSEIRNLHASTYALMMSRHLCQSIHGRPKAPSASQKWQRKYGDRNKEVKGQNLSVCFKGK